MRQAGAGTREREDSPWLGRRVAPTPSFEAWLSLERAAQAWWPAPSVAIAPATAFGAFADWALHLAMSPAKRAELIELAARLGWRWWLQLACESQQPWCVEPLPQDKRFDDPAWRQVPFAWWAQGLLMRQAWWQCATSAVPGVERHHEEMVGFAARQWLDMVSPSNWLPTNPVAIKRTLAEGGANLVRGTMHAIDDVWREAQDLPPAGAERYRVGVEVAATPGRVVLRNRLMELIQYAPSTPTAHPEPVLIVPAWIMKYYVLDLEPDDSLVRRLVAQGFTVFMISWKNPQAEDRDLGLDDYHRLGLRAALEAIDRAAPGRGAHVVGYCLGGTLAAAGTAVLARQRPDALATLTLLAAQTDFSDPGELSLFTDESQVAWLESQMARRGFLDKRQLKATFQMIRSRDLVWSYRLATYLLGERAPVSALMAWNADGTRLPERMHAEYLRAMYLDNALARGEWRLDGARVDLRALRMPLFSVGTVQDHVAPWRSVYRLHQLTDTEQTFVLTSGGHNVGIVNPPGQARSSYRMRTRARDGLDIAPDEWLATTELRDGSWWTPWFDWLAAHSSPRRKPVPMLPSLGAAPGRYVLEK
ncbi:PHA/PHB synthase family protein [Caldimonas sp. KR1-144]|uniref:PHA/PHB synthase family protein n=1 Tax=Caldimonas sp. KR1-144 TaxID=3400911 RepID=UPI003C0B4269